MALSSDTQKKRIAILGSTGSIGTQALEVIRENAFHFEVEVLTANSNADLLVSQSLEFRPNSVVIADESKYNTVRHALLPEGIKVFCGYDSIVQLMDMDTIDMVVTALVGFSGLKPTLAAIRNGKDIALANKETLVVAGGLVMSEAKKKGVHIIPVDSEHSAIFQCLTGEKQDQIEKIYLTASGGPFRGKNREQLKHATPAQALLHPNWEMGSKITIDSATLMNKGLEVIEARWLFGINPNQIEVIIHPQSIIHSLVQFVDGSMKAQMGLPDMRLPILYALGYPHRLKSSYPRFNFSDYPSLTFEKPDTATFRNLNLAYLALQKGGNLPCILNAANEIAVDAFLKEKINFLQISDVIEDSMEKIDFIATPLLNDYETTNSETRKYAELLVSGKR